MATLEGSKNPNHKKSAERSASHRLKRGAGLTALVLAIGAAAPASLEPSKDTPPLKTKGKTELAASPKLKQAFANSFLNTEGLPYAKVPKLRETIKVAVNESADQGFTIFNATETPVDVNFVKSTNQSIQSWIKAHRQGVRLHQSLTAQITPVNAPHDLLLLDNVPQYLVDPSGVSKADDVPSLTGGPSDPITRGITTSWVNFSGKIAEKEAKREAKSGLPYEYHQYKYLAVEMCQSLISVSGAEALPGGSSTVQEGEGYIGTQNSSARDNLNMYAQEVVCNSLGRALTASYFGGPEGYKQAIESDFHPKNIISPLLDPTIIR